MRVFIFSNLLPEFWKLRNHKYSHIELGPPVISHRQLAGSPRQDVDHGTMFEHGRPWLDRVVWPWCVISPWPWYIANHNGNKVNYCFLLSQWKHITAHNNFISSNKLLEMVELRPRQTMVDHLQSLVRHNYSRTRLIRTSIQGSVLERCPYKRGHYDDVTLMTPLPVLSVQ